MKGMYEGWLQNARLQEKIEVRRTSYPGALENRLAKL